MPASSSPFLRPIGCDRLAAVAPIDRYAVPLTVTCGAVLESVRCLANGPPFAGRTPLARHVPGAAGGAA